MREYEKERAIMVVSCIALNVALSSRVDEWRIGGMDRWIDG